MISPKLVPLFFLGQTASGAELFWLGEPPGAFVNVRATDFDRSVFMKQRPQQPFGSLGALDSAEIRCGASDFQ